MNKKQLFQRADQLKKVIDKARPVKEKELKELQDYYKIGFTYSSNAMEGNTLTLTETKLLIEDGITVSGKPFKDYLEAQGNADAYDYILSLAQEKKFVLSEKVVQDIHRIFYQKIDLEEAGKYHTTDIYITGTEYLPPESKKIPELMKNYMKKMQELKGSLHPIEYAALLHKGLVDIHPFSDGNGRTARLLMNLSLIQDGYGIVCISPVLRNEYISALMAGQVGKNQSNEPFIKFIAEAVIETEKDYCRMLRLDWKKEHLVEN